jgi:sec-independent protein translocase protein TatC
MLTDLIRRKRPRSEMSFLEHVEDLRISVMRVAVVFALGFFVALIFYREMPEFLRLPLDWAKAKSPGMASFGELREFTFMGVWHVLMYTAAAVGIALASPVLLYEVARFVGPALTDREKRGLIPFCLGALFLFCCGAVLAFTFLTPMSIIVWHDFAVGMGLQTDWQASDYYGFVVMMSLLTGVALQFPLALIILMWLELVRPRTLLRSWRGMLFGIVVLAAVVTPIGDPITLGILSGLLFVLYLVAVGIGTTLVRRKRLARGDKADPEDDSIDEEASDKPRSKKRAAPAASTTATPDSDEPLSGDDSGFTDDDPAPDEPGRDLRPLD